MDLERLRNLATEFKVAFDAELAGDTSGEFKLPSRDAVALICRRYLDILFPVFFLGQRLDRESLPSDSRRYFREIETLLAEQMCRAICFDLRRRDQPPPGNMTDCVGKQLDALFSQLPELSALLASDIEAAFHNDPAAPSHEEILLSYPCIEAITVQRLAHRLYLLDVPFIPRMMTEVVHSRTGIDIHPGASIGESFFIDHGTGVVIGETCRIGKRVRIYQGVTLGAKSFPLDAEGNPIKGIDRHPIVEDDVIIYSGATILGRVTIGAGSVVGGNVWITWDVPAGSVIHQTTASPKSTGENR